MIKWGKLVLAGVIASVVRYVINSGFGFAFQDLYDPISGLWRAMMTPVWIQNVIIANIVLAFIAVAVYAMINTGLGKKAEVGKKGLKFGLIMWLLGDVIGSIMTFVFMPVSLTLISTWLLSGIVIALINGQVISRIYK